MRKYIFKVLVFSASLYVILAIVDYRYSLMIRNSNFYQPVEFWEDVIQGNIQSDIVAMGSSRAAVHIDPQILDSVLCKNSYNLGIIGSMVNRQVQKYEIYRKRSSKPKVIVQNIDAWSMEYDTGYEIDQFFPYFWDRDIRKMFYRSEPFSFFEKYIPLYRHCGRYYGVSPKIFRIQYPKTLYKGYQGKVLEWDGELYKQQKSFKFNVSDTTLRMFDLFLSQAKKDSINVIFVYAPLYYGAIKKITNIDEMHQTYQNLADKYEIPILDYSDMWICYDTTFFYNAMHLNKAGAEIYTDSLANGIKRLGIL